MKDSDLSISVRISDRRRTKRQRRIRILYSFAASLILLFFILYVKFQAPEFPSTLAEDYDMETKARMQQSSIKGFARSAGKFEKAEMNTGIAALKAELEEYISSFKGQYGIYYINLENDGEFGINELDSYVAASTVKIPLNLFLYTKINEGSVDLKDTFTYIEEDYEGGTGRLQYIEKPGAKLTVKELSMLSIELSDNIATNILIRYLGRKNIKDYMRLLGGKVVYDDNNISCPKDMAIYMKCLHEFYLKDELGAELIKYFENTIFNERIPRFLPENVRVAHKTGNQVGAVHDVGIVFAKEPYIISIMSRNVDEEEGNNVIANISKKVYDFVTKE